MACKMSSYKDSMLLQVPPLPPVLVAKAAALRMHAHELSAENDFCDTCKLVVTEAASILGNLVSNSPSALTALRASPLAGCWFPDSNAISVLWGAAAHAQNFAM